MLRLSPGKIESLGYRMASPPPQQAIVTLNLQELGNLIRSWVHYDDMVVTLNKQIQNVRKLRSNYEEQVLQRLSASRQSSAIIQMGDGKVTVVDEKQSQPLSFKALETLLHAYHLQKRKPLDETDEILKFIRAQREVHITKCLKRHGVK